MTGRVPVTLSPLTGELLSSWISRHADFYGVTPLNMLRHCLPEAASLRAIDLMLSKAQANRIAEKFSIGSKTIQNMSFADSPKVAHRFIAKAPLQRCSKCNPITPGSLPVLRSELQGWRISCPHCGIYFYSSADSNWDPSFAPYRTAALLGERLLNDHAERSEETWFPPLEIARLLLMRRIPWPLPPNGDLWRYRILGAIIPDLDSVLAKLTSFPFSPKNPILPLPIRSALLAGAAIVERAGPAMLKHAARLHAGRKQEPICHGNRPFDLSCIRVGTTETNATDMKSMLFESCN